MTAAQEKTWASEGKTGVEESRRGHRQQWTCVEVTLETWAQVEWGQVRKCHGRDAGVGGSSEPSRLSGRIPGAALEGPCPEITKEVSVDLRDGRAEAEPENCGQGLSGEGTLGTLSGRSPQWGEGDRAERREGRPVWQQRPPSAEATGVNG